MCPEFLATVVCHLPGNWREAGTACGRSTCQRFPASSVGEPHYEIYRGEAGETCGQKWAGSGDPRRAFRDTLVSECLAAKCVALETEHGFVAVLVANEIAREGDEQISSLASEELIDGPVVGQRSGTD